MELQTLKHQYRETIDNQEMDIIMQKMNSLVLLQRELDETWRPLRWLWDMLSIARDKSNECGVNYSSIQMWYDNNQMSAVQGPPSSADGGTKIQNNTMNIGHDFKRPTEQNNLIQKEFSSSAATTSSILSQPRNVAIPSNKKSTLTEQLADYVSQTYSSKSSLPASLSSSPHLTRRPGDFTSSPMGMRRAISSSQRSSSVNRHQQSPTLTTTSADDHHKSSGGSGGGQSFLSSTTASTSSSVLQVYAAYDTGLASGTSVLINLSENTSSREVVDLVVKQLNMAVIMKGKDNPIYDNDTLRNFCLVAVIGNRERCLRDDFKPLNLQNPWRKGKLFVRVKSDVLAAIERQGYSTAASSQTVTASSVPSYVPSTTLSTTTTIL